MGRGKSPTCIFCFSPYRKEIIELRQKKVSVFRIYTDYKDKMGYEASYVAFNKVLTRHMVQKHKSDGIIVTVPGSKLTPHSIESFGKRMLELGMAKIESMDSSEVKLKDVIQAQKLVLDSKKLKLTENAMELMMAKMFAPPSIQMEDIVDPVEGELVDGV